MGVVPQELPWKFTLKAVSVVNILLRRNSTRILQGYRIANKYTANLRDTCNKSMHLDMRQQEQHFAVLTKYEALFDGSLGMWKEHPHDIELKPNSMPYHAKTFPILKIHLEMLKAKVQHLCDLGVLRNVNLLEGVALTFIIPKKDGSVRFI
jgi:hypothetical protein